MFRDCRIVVKYLFIMTLKLQISLGCYLMRFLNQSAMDLVCWPGLAIILSRLLVVKAVLGGGHQCYRIWVIFTAIR